MKPKNLMPLVVIFVILVAFGLVKRYMERPAPIEEAVKLPSLLPEGLSAADVVKLELYNGGKPEEKLVLERDAGDPEKWRVPTHFNAPVAKDKVNEYLKKLTGLKGEFRATVSDEDLTEYNLTDALAFHVDGFKKGDEKPTFRLLVGKAPNWQTTFVRAAENNDVFVLNENIRREAGVWQDDANEAPKADTWLNKDILDLDKDKITKVAWTTPDKRIVFERRVKETKPETSTDAAVPSESSGPSGVGSSEGEGDAATAAPTTAPVSPPKVEYEWVVAEGGTGTPHKQSGLDSLLRALDKLTASDIVDPGKTAEWGLDQPAFRCVVSVEGQDQDVVIEAGRPNPAEDGYLRIVGAPETVIYKLSKYTFEQLFPKASQFFDLPKLALDRNALNRIEITQPEGHIVLAKDGENWNVIVPVSDLKVQTSKINTLVGALAAWQAADYTYSAKDAGLDAPTRRAVLSLASGESHTITLGADSKSIDGAYSRLDGDALVTVMSRTDIEKVFVAPKDLFELTLLDISEDDINRIVVERSADAFTLARTEDAWKLTVGDQTPEVDKTKADDLASAIADLQAADVLFGTKELGAAPYATLRCEMKDGSKHVFMIGPETDGKHRLQLSGKKDVFVVDAADAMDILPPSDSLKKPEPTPPPASAPEVTPEAAGSAANTTSTDSAAPVETVASEPTPTSKTAEPSAEPSTEPEKPNEDK